MNKWIEDHHPEVKQLLALLSYSLRLQVSLS